MMELTNQPPAPTPIEPVLPPQQICNEISEEPREDLAISMEKKMEQVLRVNLKATSGNPCIYRVPKYLQENNKESYFPQTVSIGPYHHGKNHLDPMELHKWRAVNTVLKRTKHPIDKYIDAMKELEERARACYEGPIELSSDEFVRMLVLDGCFVLELFKEFGISGFDPHDPILTIGESMHLIRSDMIMLENQLPLFVLNKLLELHLGTENRPAEEPHPVTENRPAEEPHPVTENRPAEVPHPVTENRPAEVPHPGTEYRPGLVALLAREFFNPLMPTVNYWLEILTGGPIPKPIDPPADKGEFHCLDVLRRRLIEHKIEVPGVDEADKGSEVNAKVRGVDVADKRVHQWIPCATELRDAGFKFRKSNTDQFSDIKFNNGYLEIPVIHIHDGTKLLFLNLIAFEECHTNSDHGITSYLIVMDNLINTPEDVRYLRDCGIIEHSLGSDSEVANMFNTLCQSVVFNLISCDLLGLLRRGVEDYKKKKSYILKWNTWSTSLKQKYFANPWSAMSLSGALILLVLAATQTFMALYSYIKPPPGEKKAPPSHSSS